MTTGRVGGGGESTGPDSPEYSGGYRFAKPASLRCFYSASAAEQKRAPEERETRSTRAYTRAHTNVPAIILDTCAPRTKVYTWLDVFYFPFLFFFFFFLFATDFQSRVRYRLFASRESVRNFAGPLGRTDSIRAGGVRWQRK